MNSDQERNPMTTAPPTLAARMPDPQHALINGVDLHWYEVGQNTKGRAGVPLIFCHGWPELAFSWRHQLEACKAAGVWAIAPDQRGFGLTKGPEAVEDYDIEHLTGDLVGLMDHLGVDRAIFIGHDWGGIVVWQMPLLHPTRVAGVIGLNTPYMLRSPVDPIAIMRARMGDEMYIVHFQKPGEADAILDAKVDLVFDMFMRRPLGIEPPSAGLGSERQGDESVFPLVRMVQAYDPSVDPRERILDAEEMAAFVETFRASGFTGGINWYRNFTRNWEKSADLPVRIDGLPCLMITAEKDAVLPPVAAEHMPGVIGDLETVMVEGSGHWTQQEKPEQVNRYVLDWVKKRFPD
jgi:pimeloyl-ACP methyl ester carboxylesterase